MWDMSVLTVPRRIIDWSAKTVFEKYVKLRVLELGLLAKARLIRARPNQV
jgi:hypothetical protein